MTYLDQSAAAAHPGLGPGVEHGVPPHHKRGLGGRTEADHIPLDLRLTSLCSLVLENHPLDTDSGLREHRDTPGLVPDS